MTFGNGKPDYIVRTAVLVGDTSDYTRAEIKEAGSAFEVLDGGVWPEGTLIYPVLEGSESGVQFDGAQAFKARTGFKHVGAFSKLVVGFRTSASVPTGFRTEVKVKIAQTRSVAVVEPPSVGIAKRRILCRTAGVVTRGAGAGNPWHLSNAAAADLENEGLVALTLDEPGKYAQRGFEFWDGYVWSTVDFEVLVYAAVYDNPTDFRLVQRFDALAANAGSGSGTYPASGALDEGFSIDLSVAQNKLGGVTGPTPIPPGRLQCYIVFDDTSAEDFEVAIAARQA